MADRSILDESALDQISGECICVADLTVEVAKQFCSAGQLFSIGDSIEIVLESLEYVPGYQKGTAGWFGIGHDKCGSEVQLYISDMEGEGADIRLLPLPF